MLKSILYSFLIAPKYRLWRHILLVSVFALLSFRRILFIYRNDEQALGSSLYVLCFITLAVYLFSVYSNLYFLVPHFLLRKKYIAYSVGLLLVAFIPIAYQLGQGYVVCTLLDLPHKLISYFSLTIVAANLSSFGIILVCILGTSIPLVFKVRVQEIHRISQMEQEYIKSELDRLKEQISPAFLSNILNKTSVLVKTDPQRASDMLMRLGQLLRYQLYDCNRNNVLLSAEINFIKGYLDLEQMYCKRFEYKLSVDDTIRQLFIPPLLFIPFIQHTISKVEDSDSQASLHISFAIEKNSLFFICQSTNNVFLSEVELFAIKKRLSLLYPDNYRLSVTHNEVKLQLKNTSGL